jgi:HD-GYP domain-containing protein (c-di-GMP phosphodiesterase class II)
LLTLFAFLFFSLLLESDDTTLRVEAKGSTSFIMHLASALLFGGFWGAILEGTSTGIVQFLRRRPPAKLVFNIAQRVLCMLGATALYSALGGSVPASFLAVGAVPVDPTVKRELLLYGLLAATYFTINSTLVSIAVALSSRRKFREIWHLNTRGIIGYDLGASLLALPVAVFYSRWEGLGLVLATLPIVAVRHFYRLYHQLQDSGQEMLAVMVKAIEARDPYTSGHSERVSRISRAVALELGLPTQQVEEIATAALLHDVGKIHEEFAPLLRKEARLTPEETALMQTHVVRSAELVGIVSKFKGRILEAVRHHHERWDGQGYPDGVQGKAIPIGARIILVADTVDAMTTDRPYRKALGLDVVLAELQRCKGTQFDPDLIELMANSVAIRRLINLASLGPEMDSLPDLPLASRRISFAAGSFWRRRGA